MNGDTEGNTMCISAYGGNVFPVHCVRLPARQDVGRKYRTGVRF